MLLPIPEFLMTPEQWQAWCSTLDQLRLLEECLRGSDDPIVFHGTRLLSAARILREGFEPYHCRVAPENSDRPLSGLGVNWGTLNIAAWAAQKMFFRTDDPPVLLAARVSALRSAGTLHPDFFAMETGLGEPYSHSPRGEWRNDPTWRECLEQTGCMTVLGCRDVPGLQLVNPLRNVPVHPRWRADREDRVRDALAVQPVEGFAEATADTHPPTMSEEDAWRRELASWKTGPASTPVEVPEAAIEEHDPSAFRP